MTNAEKAAAVQAERERLGLIFAGAAQNAKDFISESLDRLAWLAVSIRELQKSVDENGTMLPYSNGPNQTGWRKSPDVETLIAYEKLSNSLITPLLKVLPEDASGPSALEALRQEFDCD